MSKSGVSIYNNTVERKKFKHYLNFVKQISVLIQQSLNHLCWPVVCLNCQKNISETDNKLCQSCWDQLIVCTGSDYCRRCGRDAGPTAILEGSCPDCQGKEIYFDGIARSGVYAKNLKKMILNFKNGKTELNSILGFLADSALQGSNFIDEIDFFVPIPLHWSRKLIRGYNQAHVLTKKINHRKFLISTDLVRIRRTKAQPAMASPTARARNVAGAFAVRYGHKFTGKKICLVDDIKTTGATLNECAKTLKEAGAEKVFALTLAVAGQKLS